MNITRILFFLCALTLFSCSKTKVPDAKVGTQKHNEPMQIVLFNYEFYPTELQIPVGKEVEFTNKEAVKHCLRIESLDVSEDMEPEAVFSYTFEKAGSYVLTSSCDPAKMKATIVVK